MDAQIAVSPGLYMELLNLLETVWGIIFYVFAGVEIIMIFSRSLSSKVVLSSFWCPWRLLGLPRGSLGSLLCLVDLGGLFHRFGRCPNHGHFLEEFIFKSAPKLVLVSLASVWPCPRL